MQPSAAQRVAVLALLFDLENNFGSSKAAAKGEGAKRLSHKQDRRACEAGFAAGKTATSCAG